MTQHPIKKRRSRREAMAFFFSTDMADIDWYQPGRAKIPVFAPRDWYYCATRKGERLPEGWSWQMHGQAYEYRIYRTTARGEAT